MNYANGFCQTMLRLLSSLILLLLFAPVVWALDSAGPGKDKPDGAEASITNISAPADVPRTEESDITKVATEEKTDLSDNGGKKSDTTEAVTEEKEDIGDDGDDESDTTGAVTEEKADNDDDDDEESDPAENTIGEKTVFATEAGKKESDPAGAAPVRKAYFGVSLEWEEYKWKNGDKDQIFLFTPIYRPTKSLELSIETPYAISKTEEETARGIGDVTFTGNYVLFWDDYENDDPLVTLEGSIMFDTGSFSKGLGKGSNEYTLMPIVSKGVSESLTLFGEIGYTIVTNGEDDSRKNYWPYAIGVDWTASERISLMSEYSANQHPDVTKPDQKVVEFGLSYEIADWLTVSGSFIKGVNEESPQWGIGFGLLIEYPEADVRPRKHRGPGTH